MENNPNLENKENLENIQFVKGSQFNKRNIFVVAVILLIAGVTYSGISYWQDIYNYFFDPTADWETYRNEEYGFEFKYPPEFNVKETEDKNTVGVSIFDPTKEKARQEAENACPEDWIVTCVPPGIGIDIINTDSYNNLKKYLEGLDYTILKTQGITWYRYQIEADWERVYYVLEKDGKMYRFSSSPSDEAELNPILSTFKFIDPTADWKTYRNEEYGFEFRHPKDIKVEETIPGFDFGDYQLSVLTLEKVKETQELDKANPGIPLSEITEDEWNIEQEMFQSNKSKGSCDYDKIISGWREDYVCEVKTLGETKFLIIYESGGAPYGSPRKKYITFNDHYRFSVDGKTYGDVGSYLTLPEFEILESKDPHKDVIIKILSTFKFIE